jgi:hypothetical protein
MSPPGIPYFYGATDERTALAELRGLDGEVATVAFWMTRRDTFIVDLARLPEVPSIFDHEQAALRSERRFLHGFAREISKPMRAHDNPAVDYVPTQVVAEYIRHCVQNGFGELVEGIMYPSAVLPGGTNLVFFVGNAETTVHAPLLSMIGPPIRYEAVEMSTRWIQIR